MASYIVRRKFLATLGGAAAAWPLAARAQQGERARWIGVLIGVAEDAETKAWVATFHKQLDELGWRATCRDVALRSGIGDRASGHPRRINRPDT